MIEKKRQAARKRPRSVMVGRVATVVLVVVAVQARGQEGPLATLGLSFGGSYTANDPGKDESDLTTRLSFDVSSVTQTQSFGISADGQFVFDEEGLDFERPGLSLEYARANRSTAFDVGLSYRIRDVDGTEEVIDPVTLTVIDLIEDDGTLESIEATAGLETGRDAPFGTETRFRYTDRTYSETSDPDLTDLTSWQIDTTLRFDIDPRVSLRTSASHRVTEEDDETQTESRTTRLGFGGDFLIDQLWSASFELNYSIFATEQDFFGNRILDEEDGAGFSLLVTRQFRDGTLGLALGRSVSDIGAEDSLSAFRDRELVNGGEVSWSVGLVSFPNGETAPVVSASYAMPTPRGSFSARLQQSTSANSDDESVVNTLIGVDFDQAINANSGWSLNGSLSSVEIAGDEDRSQARAQVGISYNYALTRDWDLSTSLRHRITYEDGEENDRASILSLSLERSFSFRP